MSDRQRRQRRTYETFLVETDEKYLRLLEMLADQLKIKDDKIIILQYQLEALEKRLADAEHLAR